MGNLSNKEDRKGAYTTLEKAYKEYRRLGTKDGSDPSGISAGLQSVVDLSLASELINYISGIMRLEMDESDKNLLLSSNE
jgi:hypothetical protein